MADKVKFLHESIDQIIELFDGNLDAVTWNRLKVEHFLTLLDRQSHELQKCVSSYSTTRQLNCWKFGQIYGKQTNPLFLTGFFCKQIWEETESILQEVEKERLKAEGKLFIIMDMSNCSKIITIIKTKFYTASCWSPPKMLYKWAQHTIYNEQLLDFIAKTKQRK